MNRTMFKRLFAALAVATIWSCSNGTTTAVSPAVSKPAYKLGHLKAVLFIPSKSKSERIDKLVTNAYRKRYGKRPAFLPSDTSEIDFTLVAVNGSSVSSSGAGSHPSGVIAP